MEEMAVDKRLGFFVNHDLAGEGEGVDELGLRDVAPADASAVYNATGVRVRQYPITPEKLLDDLSPLT
jgi:xanthine dehydrogenase YagR molybdenum-binding subunit